MSFNLVRNPVTNISVKKEITNSITQDNIKQQDNKIAGSNKINYTSVKINDTIFDSTIQSQLSSIQLTKGNAIANKPLICDNNGSINGINELSCSHLYANNVEITADSFGNNSNNVSTNDTNNILLTNVVNGTALPSKALITDNDNNISNINNISFNNLQINNKKIVIDNETNLVSHTNSWSYQQNISNNFLFGSNSTIAGQGDFEISRGYWNNYAYSPQLDIYVASAYDSTNGSLRRFIYSIDNGIRWSEGIFPSDLTLTNNVFWLERYNYFIGISNNQIVKSLDGINWTYIYKFNNNPYLFVSDYSYQLDLIICIGLYTSIYSNDGGITWYEFNYKNTISNINNPSMIRWFSGLNVWYLITKDPDIYISRDGFTWSKCVGYMSGQFHCIEYNKISGQVIAYSDNNLAYISTDGYHFNPSYCSISIPKAVKFIPEINGYIMFCSNNNINYSLDGLTPYNFYSLGLSIDLRIIIYNPKLACCIFLGYGIYGYLSYTISCLGLGTNGMSYYNKLKWNNKECIGLNSGNDNLTYAFHVNDSTGKLVRFYDANSSGYMQQNYLNIIDLNINNSGNLTINAPLGVTSSGISLNGTKLTVPISTISTYLSNIIYGKGGSNSILTVDNSLNVTDINSISISGNLYINGSLATQNDVFDVKSGTSNSNKIIVSNSDSNIINTNFKINNLQFGSIKFTAPIQEFYKFIYNVNVQKYLCNDVSGSLYKGLEYTANAPLICRYNTTDTFTTFGTYSDDHGVVLMSYYDWGFKTFSSNEIGTMTQVNLNTNIYSSFNIIRFIHYCSYWKCCIIVSYYGILYSYDLKQFISTNWSSDLGNFYDVLWVEDYKTLYFASDVGVLISTSPSTWTNIETPFTACNSLCYSKKLNMIIAGNNNGSVNPFYYSINGGASWAPIKTFDMSFSNTKKCIVWRDDLELFIYHISAGVCYISNNGVSWECITNVYSISNSTTMRYFDYLGLTFCSRMDSSTKIGESIDFITSANLPTSANTGQLNMTVDYCPKFNSPLFDLSSTSSLAVRNVNKSNLLSPVDGGTSAYVYINKNIFINDIVNQRIGLGLQPSYLLEISNDSAFKSVGGSTWTTSSDKRVKKNIKDADLESCYNIIDSLELKRYKWKDEIYSNSQVNDRRQLGWIAQDVQQILPESVFLIDNKYGLDNCLSIDPDQIYNNLFGCVQYLINESSKISELEILN